MQPKLLSITGAAGFIGRRLAERALERGMRVRGLDLDPSPLAGLDVEALAGDILDAERVAELCEGADAVVHTAAVVREDGPLELFERVNVEGTRQVARACAASGAHLVHLSSVMVFGFDYPAGVTEDGPYPTDERNPYCVTKLRSEGAALGAGGPVTILRPGDVYGPGSVPWVVRPVELMRRGLFVLPDGGRGILDHLHVDNLIDAVFLAFDGRGIGMPITVTDGAPSSCLEYFGRLARAAGLPPPRTRPSWLLAPAFAALAAACDALSIEPPARASALRFLQRPHAYSIARARSVLGYSPRIDLERGMSELARSL